MANWVCNSLTIYGDPDLIASIVKEHFQIEPRGNPNELDRICFFHGLVSDDDNGKGPNFGFQLSFGATSEQATAWPPVCWDGSITNPFYVFWCSKWGESGFVPITLAARYTEMKFEYTWRDTVNDIGGACVSEGGIMWVVDSDEPSPSDPV